MIELINQMAKTTFLGYGLVCVNADHSFRQILYIFIWPALINFIPKNNNEIN